MITLVPWMFFTAGLVFAMSFLRLHGRTPPTDPWPMGGGALWWTSVASLVALAAFPFFAGMRFATDNDPAPVTTLVSALAAGGIAFFLEKSLQRVLAARASWLDRNPFTPNGELNLESEIRKTRHCQRWRLTCQIALVALMLCAYFLATEAGEEFLESSAYNLAYGF